MVYYVYYGGGFFIFFTCLCLCLCMISIIMRKKRMESITGWMRYNGVPHYLQNSIRNYYSLLQCVEFSH